MHAWMYDIGALLAIAFAFVLLISFFRMLLLFSLKVLLVAGLCFYGWRTYGSSISLPGSLSEAVAEVPAGRIMELGGDAVQYLWRAGGDVLADMRANPLTSQAASYGSSLSRGADSSSSGYGRISMGRGASMQSSRVQPVRLQHARAIHSAERRF